MAGGAVMKARANKYGNVKTVVDGVTFDSKKEARRYGELMLLQRTGAISGLVLQPEFPIVVNGKKIGKFTADFRYQDAGGVVVEDVKSPITRKNAAYRLRKRLVEALYPVTVVEV